MNDFNHHWQKLVAQKPLLNEDRAMVEIRAGNLKHLLQKFYLFGFNDQMTDRPQMPSFFDQLFGKQ